MRNSCWPQVANAKEQRHLENTRKGTEQTLDRGPNEEPGNLGSGPIEPRSGRRLGLALGLFLIWWQ